MSVAVAGRECSLAHGGPRLTKLCGSAGAGGSDGYSGDASCWTLVVTVRGENLQAAGYLLQSSIETSACRPMSLRNAATVFMSIARVVEQDCLLVAVTTAAPRLDPVGELTLLRFPHWSTSFEDRFPLLVSHSKSAA